MVFLYRPFAVDTVKPFRCLLEDFQGVLGKQSQLWPGMIEIASGVRLAGVLANQLAAVHYQLLAMRSVFVISGLRPRESITAETIELGRSSDSVLRRSNTSDSELIEIAQRWTSHKIESLSRLISEAANAPLRTTSVCLSEMLLIEKRCSRQLAEHPQKIITLID